MQVANINLAHSFNKLKMIIEKQITQTQAVEVKLPFFSQRFDSYFYMITEAEENIWVYISPSMATISATSKGAGPNKSNHEDAIKGKEISERDFWAAYDKAVSIMQTIFPHYAKAGAVNQ